MLLQIEVCFAQQNLIPNGSFEQLNDTMVCGISFDSTVLENTLLNWSSPTEGSPDIYFKSYTSDCWNHQPSNQNFGSQTPHDGNNFVGIYTYYTGNNYREYIQTKLSSPIIINQKYIFNMYVSLSDYSDFASNNLSVCFSNNNIINYHPQIVFNQIVTDTVNWVLLSDTIDIDSSYQYITIGNFYKNDNTNISYLNNGGNVSYYYIDDISLIPLNNDIPTDIKNIINSNKNYIINNIYDLYGRKVSNNINSLPSGVYFIDKNNIIYITIIQHY